MKAVKQVFILLLVVVVAIVLFLYHVTVFGKGIMFSGCLSDAFIGSFIFLFVHFSRQILSA